MVRAAPVWALRGTAPAEQQVGLEELSERIRKESGVGARSVPAAGLEEGRRLGEVVDLKQVKVDWPQAPADFSRGAAIVISAGASRRFRESVEEKIAAGELPPETETNKLLAPLRVKGRLIRAGALPLLAAKEMGLGIDRRVGQDKERVMPAYRQEVHDID